MIEGRKKGQERKKEIIEQAIHLILSRQARRFTLANIADGLGVTEGSIYRHFKNKKEIIETVVEMLELDLIPPLTKRRSKKDDPVETMQALLHSYLSSPKKQREVAVIASLVFSNLGDRPLRRRITNLINRYIQEIEDIIRQGQEAKVMRKDLNAGAAASLFFGLVHWLAFLNYLVGVPKELLENRSLFENVYLRGIRVGSRRRTREKTTHISSLSDKQKIT